MSDMPGWNFADVWEVVAECVPDAPAQVKGDRVVAWGDFDRRADGIAKAFLDAGVEHGDKAVHYLYNGPEYLESMFAMFKVGLAPVNTNYRYTEDELVYLWDNADAVAVVFHGAFVDTIERIRDRVPGVKVWLWIDDGSGPCPAWATPYEDAAASATERTVAPWGRDGDDLLLLYTGGRRACRRG
jgi:3-oxocholest-4-en-26-oate---CoA ligase